MTSSLQLGYQVEYFIELIKELNKLFSPRFGYAQLMCFMEIPEWKRSDLHQKKLQVYS